MWWHVIMKVKNWQPKLTASNIFFGSVKFLFTFYVAEVPFLKTCAGNLFFINGARLVDPRFGAAACKIHTTLEENDWFRNTLIPYKKSVRFFDYQTNRHDFVDYDVDFLLIYFLLIFWFFRKGVVRDSFAWFTPRKYILLEELYLVGAANNHTHTYPRNLWYPLGEHKSFL